MSMSGMEIPWFSRVEEEEFCRVQSKRKSMCKQEKLCTGSLLNDLLHPRVCQAQTRNPEVKSCVAVTQLSFELNQPTHPAKRVHEQEAKLRNRGRIQTKE